MNELRIAPALAASAMLLLLSACPAGNGEGGAHGSAAEMVDVRTTTIAASESSSYVELTGSVTGRNSVPLTTKLMSDITYLEVEEGQQVSAGDVLVRIDDSDIVAMRSEAAAYRAEADAALGEVQAVREQAVAGVGQAEAAVSQARAALEDSERDHERMSVLFREQIISRSEMDKFDLALKVARENLGQAEAMLRQANAGVSQADSRTPQVEAKRSQANAKDMQAAAMQDYSVLRAPFDGVVTARYFDAGQLAVPGQPIIVVEQDGVLRVRVSIPDRVASDLSVGDSLDIVVEGQEGRMEIQARIAILGQTADPASRTVLAELTIDDPSGLHSGQFVRVRVPVSRQLNILVPEAAVVSDGDRQFVWRVSAGGMLTTAPVDIGDRINGSVEVLRGLSAGDTIVTDPHPGLYAGARTAVSAASEGH